MVNVAYMYMYEAVCIVSIKGKVYLFNLVSQIYGFVF